MIRKEVRIKLEKDKSIEKNVFSFDYYKAKNKEDVRFSLFNHLMTHKDTVIHINTNMTVSLKPSEDRDTVIKFRDMCEKDNLDFSLNPAERTGKEGFLGKFLAKEENKIPAYNILIYIPAGRFNKDIFNKYLKTYFFRAGIGFNKENFSRIKSDYEIGLLTADNFYKIFEYDLFDAFEFSHIKIISDMMDIKELDDIVYQDDSRHLQNPSGNSE